MSSTSDVKSVTRASIAAKITELTELTSTQSHEVVDLILEQITNFLAAGDEVLITGFGRFMTMHKKSRKGRNPQTNEPLTIEARRVMKFRASPQLGKNLTEAFLDRLSK